MVKNILTEDMINAGLEILEFLDRKRINITTSLWLYSSESEKWHLIIASPIVRHKGPKYLYRIIRSTIFKIKHHSLSLRDIKVVDNSAPLIKLINMAIHSDSGVRFTNNYINDFLIEDAYIYRSK